MITEAVKYGAAFTNEDTLLEPVQLNVNRTMIESKRKETELNLFVEQSKERVLSRQPILLVDI